MNTSCGGRYSRIKKEQKKIPLLKWKRGFRKGQKLIPPTNRLFQERGSVLVPGKCSLPLSESLLLAWDFSKGIHSFHVGVRRLSETLYIQPFGSDEATHPMHRRVIGLQIILEVCILWILLHIPLVLIRVFGLPQPAAEGSGRLLLTEIYITQALQTFR